MSVFTDSASRAGISTMPSVGTDDRELFARNFTDDVLEAYEQTYDFLGYVMEKSITSGKSDVFPVIGRKRDAADHVVGEEVYGGTVPHDEVEVSLDNFTVDSVFIPDIDQLMAKYDLSGPYSRQLGESLANVSNTRVGNSLVLASRVTVAPYPGGPVPSFYTDAAIATDASKLETGIFKALEYIRVNDIGGGNPVAWLPHPQHLLFVRYTGIDAEATTGTGNRGAGTMGPVAGLSVRGTNSVPRTNYTIGLSKYQGDFSGTYGIVANRMAVAKLTRRGKKVVIKDREERLGTQIIASQLEGYGPLRPECSFELSSSRA